MKSVPYPAYRPSGVAWLGDVPEHWATGHLRRWFAIVNGGTPSSSEEAYWDGETAWLTPDDLGQNEGVWIAEGRRTITEDGVLNSSARVSPSGSIVLSTRAPIGHLAVTSVPAATNQGCRTLVPCPEADSRFAYYTLLAGRLVLQSLGKGSTFMELTPTDLGSLRLPLPPLDEQRAIAALLDRETERIDALVAKKRQLIERLDEYRTALITRTVTHGLPPNAARAAGLDPSPRLRPSGIEWLGDVPEHWRMARIADMFTARSGGTPSTAEETYWEGDVPWVSAKDMKALHIVDTEDHISDQAVRESATSLVPPNTVLLVSRSGILRHTLPVGLAASEVAINQDIKGLIPAARSVDPLYFVYWIHGLQSLLLSLWRQQGATVESLDFDAVRSTSLPLPPLNEQNAIAAFLDRETVRVTELVGRVEAATERLQEYRTALITAAVTGKIDVRELATTSEGPTE